MTAARALRACVNVKNFVMGFPACLSVRGGDHVELRCFLWENDNRFMDEFLRVTSKLLSFAMLLHFDLAQGQGCRRVGCSRAGDAAYAQHSLARAVVLPGCAADGDRAAIRCCDDYLLGGASPSQGK